MFSCSSVFPQAAVSAADSTGRPAARCDRTGSVRSEGEERGAEIKVCICKGRSFPAQPLLGFQTPPSALLLHLQSCSPGPGALRLGSGMHMGGWCFPLERVPGLIPFLLFQNEENRTLGKVLWSGWLLAAPSPMSRSISTWLSYRGRGEQSTGNAVPRFALFPPSPLRAPLQHSTAWSIQNPPTEEPIQA